MIAEYFPGGFDCLFSGIIESDGFLEDMFRLESCEVIDS
jgi:hypothetical protein